jgi:hypothetical protein
MSAAESYDFVDRPKQRRLSWALNDNTQSEVYASLQVKDVHELVIDCASTDVALIQDSARHRVWSRMRRDFSARQAIDGVAATTALFIAVVCLITH